MHTEGSGILNGRLLVVAFEGWNDAGEAASGAVRTLKDLLDHWRDMIPYYKVRPHNPSMPGWADWLEKQGTPFKD